MEFWPIERSKKMKLFSKVKFWTILRKIAQYSGEQVSAIWDPGIPDPGFCFNDTQILIPDPRFKKMSPKPQSQIQKVEYQSQIWIPDLEKFSQIPLFPENSRDFFGRSLRNQFSTGKERGPHGSTASVHHHFLHNVFRISIKTSRRKNPAKRLSGFILQKRDGKKSIIFTLLPG